MHLFGKVLLPDSDPSHAGPEKYSHQINSAHSLTNFCRSHDAYFMFRAFIPGGSETARLHCIHMAETENSEGKMFQAIFFQNDPLEWFDT